MNREILDRQIASPYRFGDAGRVQQKLHAVIGTGRVTVGMPFRSNLPSIIERLRELKLRPPWFSNHSNWARATLFRNAQAWISCYPHIHITVTGWGDRFWNGAGMWCMRRDTQAIRDYPASCWIDIVMNERVVLLGDVLERPPEHEAINVSS